ncbi:MAG: S49 family peptidase [Devosia nanyangense]|uniref:S49 family peptidase n=1 Tax=Devosia nanyangense TaxID=1228055 RepID=A0A933L082_9HYPH|nr:S49 family peptidase [Devosia nanyangense]
MPRNLDLALRTPGQVLLLERGHAQALVDRGLEEHPPRQSRSLLSRAIGAVARLGRPVAMEDDEGPAIDRSKLAMPEIIWAGTVEYGDGYAIVEGIAIVDVEGVLTPDGYIDWWSWCWVGGYAQIGAAIRAARADDRVHAVFMRVDSPGGYVDGCFDLAEEIAADNGKAGGKPVWVYARMSCSAAYALSASADRIVAAAEADVGSIGVLILHVDVSGLYAEHGIKIEAIESLPRKTDGAEWKPLSEDARAHLKGAVDQIARRFAGVVTAGRDLSADDIAALQARWFLAQHDDPAQSGLALKLVDEIASERAAFAALQSSLSNQTETGAPAATGEDAATAARAGGKKETDMSLKEQIEALRTKAAKGDKAAIAELKAMGVPVKADTSTTEEDDPEVDEEQAATEEEPAEEEDGEDETEPKPAATGTKAGFALLKAPEAKGRTALANELAAKVASKKLTYGEAKKMLAAAPKGSRLGDAMAGRDHNPGADGADAGKPAAGLGTAVDRMLARTGRKATA